MFILSHFPDSRPARRNPVVSMLLKHGANINAGDKVRDDMLLFLNKKELLCSLVMDK